MTLTPDFLATFAIDTHEDRTVGRDNLAQDVAERPTAIFADNLGPCA